ncbi:MAG: iron hydrogenase small subunit, partial [Clostridia bacterium]|nr:iron hydrogenase small subunit [Clostridia bacterium]
VVVSGLTNAESVIERIQAGEKIDFVEVMACPGGCINGGGQPFAMEGEKQARSAGLYKSDRLLSIRRAEENPIMSTLYSDIIKGKVHKLLHVNYAKKSEE